MKAIEIIMIPVKDQQKAKEFYLRIGFTILAEAPMGNGQNWLQMGLPNSETSISLAAFHGIIIETDDIEKEVEKLKQRALSQVKSMAHPGESLHG